MGENYKKRVLSAPTHPDIPEGIGPHEGIELELMLSGKKPAAMFFDTYPDSDYPIPEDEFQPYVDSGRMLKKEVLYPSPLPKERLRKKINVTHSRHVFYALPDQAWRLDALDEIKRDLYVNKKPWHENLDRKIGQLLGYTDNQIEIFIEHSRKIRAELKLNNTKDL